MKNILSYILLACLFISCFDKKAAAPVEAITKSNKILPMPESGKFKLGSSVFETNSNSILSDVSSLPSISETNGIFDPVSVELLLELTELFNPEGFPCIDGKLKEKINKLKKKSSDGTKEVTGFIPVEVKKELDKLIGFDLKKTVMLKYGANPLLHNFTYTDNTTKKESKILRADDSPTYSNFNLLEYSDSSTSGFPYINYTLDCAGYFSASIQASGGVKGNEVDSSAKLSNSNKKSLVLIACKIQSPLFLAFNGEGVLKGETPEIYKKRFEILKSVLKRLPKNNPNISINLVANYFVILASNTGTGGFNGDAGVEGMAGGGIGFATASVSGKTTTSVSRTNKFSSYQTYILDSNDGLDVYPIPLKDFQDLVNQMEVKSKEKTS